MGMVQSHYRHQKMGFTLVELSVVLVIIALITGMGISAGVDSLESARRAATQSKLDVIEDALMSFRQRYNRLPCPGDAKLATTDTNYGVEAANLGTCTGGTPAASNLTTATTPTPDPLAVPSGAVPVSTLGLPNDFMYDGWGRKFHYEVSPAMTFERAFSYTQKGDNCAINITDHSGTTWTGTAPYGIKPVYALVSYGKNGIGAYLKQANTQLIDTISSNEQTNVRAGISSPTTTPTIHVMNGVNGSGATGGYYDDIVRFKSIYQMMDKAQRDLIPYKGPEMALAYTTTSGTQISYGKAKCGWYQDFAGTTPAAVGANPIFIGFTPSNTNFFVYHTNSCKLYSINGTLMTAVIETTPVPNCPAAATVGAMALGNGMLVLDDSAATSLVRIWKLTGTAEKAKYIELPNALSPVLSAAPENLSISANGEYIVVSRQSSSAYKRIYVKKDDTYIQLSSALQPETAMGGWSIYSNVISPDGRYYASTWINGGNTYLYVWRNVSGVFTYINRATLSGITTPNVLAFSPNSDYVAVGSSTSLYVVSINPATEALTPSSVMSLGAGIKSVSFSGDGMFMGAALDTTGSNALALYRRTGMFSFTADTTSAAAMTFNASSNGKAIAFSR